MALLGFCEDSETFVKRFDTVTVASRELYQFLSPKIEMKMTANEPQSAIPTILLHRKLHDFRRKDLLLSGIGAFGGMLLYLWLAYSGKGNIIFTLPGSSLGLGIAAAAIFLATRLRNFTRIKRIKALAACSY